MGADRYTTCPRCVHTYEEAESNLVDRIYEDYPSLSDAAKEALLPVLKEEQGIKAPERTFREDWESGHGDNDPTVAIIYKGSYSECGLELKVNEDHVIWGGPEL